MYWRRTCRALDERAKGAMGGGKKIKRTGVVLRGEGSQLFGQEIRLNADAGSPRRRALILLYGHHRI